MMTGSKAVFLFLCSAVLVLAMSSRGVAQVPARECATGQCKCADIPGGSDGYEWQNNNCSY